MPDDAAPTPLPSAAETAARAALDYVARLGGVAPVLLAFADEPLVWTGDRLTAPAGGHGSLQAVLAWPGDCPTAPIGDSGFLRVMHLPSATPSPGLLVMLHLPPMELHSSTIHIPAHVFPRRRLMRRPIATILATILALNVFAIALAIPAIRAAARLADCDAAGVEARLER